MSVLNQFTSVSIYAIIFTLRENLSLSSAMNIGTDLLSFSLIAWTCFAKNNPILSRLICRLLSLVFLPPSSLWLNPPDSYTISNGGWFQFKIFTSELVFNIDQLYKTRYLIKTYNSIWPTCRGDSNDVLEFKVPIKTGSVVLEASYAEKNYNLM